MQLIARQFRKTFVEGRFAALFFAFMAVGMRSLLFLYKGLPADLMPGGSHLWPPIATLCQSPWLSLFCSTLFIFLISWILSLLNKRHNLLRSRTGLPFALPLFLLSLHPRFLAMSGDYVSVVFILLAFFPLLDSYQKPITYLYSFRSGVLLAFASLFQIYTLCLLPLWWMGERDMRGFKFRSFVNSLFGIFLVYISLFSVFWFTDNLPGFFEPFSWFAAFSLPELSRLSPLQGIFLSLAILYFLFSAVSTAKAYIRDKTLTLTVLRLMTVWAAVLLSLQFIYWGNSLFFLIFSMVLISFLNAYFLSKISGKTQVLIVYFFLVSMLSFYLFEIL